MTPLELNVLSAFNINAKDEIDNISYTRIDDIERVTNLDYKTIQTTCRLLAKNGYITLWRG